MDLFRERLKTLLKERALTQKKLADAIGITERMIRHYVAGTLSPSVETIISIADFFDVSLDYLTGRSDVRGGTGPDEIAAGREGI